jgi:hypothetical protein
MSASEIITTTVTVAAFCAGFYYQRKLFKEAQAANELTRKHFFDDEGRNCCDKVDLHLKSQVERVSDHVRDRYRKEGKVSELVPRATVYFRDGSSENLHLSGEPMKRIGSAGVLLNGKYYAFKDIVGADLQREVKTCSTIPSELPSKTLLDLWKECKDDKDVIWTELNMKKILADYAKET